VKPVVSLKPLIPAADRYRNCETDETGETADTADTADTVIPTA
jgi:hypothetical protein